MEIRISLDQVEPPAGRLELVTDPQQASDAGGQEVSFTLAGSVAPLEEVIGPTEDPA